jgi:transcriptional regulator of acetoin/glycerol metabolism
VLICADIPLAMDQIAMLAYGLREPMRVQTAWNRLTAPTRGTLVLHDVQTLNREQQQGLLEWLKTNDDVQLVSISTEPLFPLVEEGEFLELLYYQLNTIYVDALNIHRDSNVAIRPR